MIGTTQGDIPTAITSDLLPLPAPHGGYSKSFRRAAMSGLLPGLGAYVPVLLAANPFAVLSEAAATNGSCNKRVAAGAGVPAAAAKKRKLSAKKAPKQQIKKCT
eukprot:4161752-Prymnesium_polylepis.1